MSLLECYPLLRYKKNSDNIGAMRERSFSIEAIAAQFPEYIDRLNKGEYIQIYDGKRLLSAEDKLERFGGIDTLKRNLSFAREQARVEPYILQACRDGIMVPREIIHFVNAIITPNELDPSLLFYAIEYTNRHSDGESIRKIEGITCLQPTRRDSYRVLERPGFETTQEGTRQLAKWLQGESNPHPKFNLSWKPNPA